MGLVHRLPAGLCILVLLASTLAGCVTIQWGEGPPRDPPQPRTTLHDPSDRTPAMPVHSHFPELEPLPLPEPIETPRWLHREDPGQGLAPGLWAQASTRHPVTLTAEAPRVLITGQLKTTESTGTLTLVPYEHQDPFFETHDDKGPGVLLLPDVKNGNRTGTLVVGPGTTTFTSAKANDPIIHDVTRIIARDGQARAPLPHILPLGIGQEPWTPPAPYNTSTITLLQLPLPERFSLDAAQLTFIDEDGNTTTLSGPVADLTTKRVYTTTVSLVTPTWQRLLGPTTQIEPIDTFDLLAHKASGTLTLHAKDQVLEDNPLSLRLNETERFTFTAQTEGFKITGLEGNARDLSAGGHPRLGAAVAVLPNLVEVEGEPGEGVRFQLLLVEGSQGATAHLNGHRIDGAEDVDLVYKDSGPFALTHELIDFIDDVADWTLNNPIAAPVTVPMMVAMTIAVPFVALMELPLAFFSMFVEPHLGGTIAPGEAHKATFEARIGEETTELTLVIQGHNFPDQEVQVVLRPTDGPHG